MGTEALLDASARQLRQESEEAPIDKAVAVDACLLHNTSKIDS
jgi:hypothetical protein